MESDWIFEGSSNFGMHKSFQTGWAERKYFSIRIPPRAANAMPRLNLKRLEVSEATSPNCRKCLKDITEIVKNIFFYDFIDWVKTETKWNNNNLKAPIHSCGGLFKIIACTNRRRFLQKKNARRKRKLKSAIGNNREML